MEGEVIQVDVLAALLTQSRVELESKCTSIKLTGLGIGSGQHFCDSFAYKGKGSAGTVDSDSKILLMHTAISCVCSERVHALNGLWVPAQKDSSGSHSTGEFTYRKVLAVEG